MDFGFSALTSQRPEFKNALKTWSEQLEPKLSAMEQDRLAVIAHARKRTVYTALSVGACVLLLIFLTRGSMLLFMLIGGGMLTAVISGVAWLPLMTMKSQTKQHIVGAAAAAFGFEYETLHEATPDVRNLAQAGTWMTEHLSQAKTNPLFSSGQEVGVPTPAFEVLRSVKLLPSYDDRKFEDLIQGNRAGAAFSMVECKLTEEQGSGKNRRTVTKFQGLLFHIQYPDRFLGKTLIARQGWWKGWFGDKELKKVDLVAKELEDNFTIYSNDQVEARALLTPDRMARLIALERHFKGGKLRGVFEGDHLTLALQAKNQFEAGSIWKPLVDPERFVSALTEIGLVCDVIDGFLTRDWVKDKF